jgi:hypothetical protein
MPFIPIEMDDFIELHLRANPDEDRDDLRARLRRALKARRAGVLCECGNPIWVIGSAVAGHACFTCITLEAYPDSDYEIAEACRLGELW